MFERRGKGTTETVPERIARLILQDAAAGWNLDDGCLEDPGAFLQTVSMDSALHCDMENLDSETLSVCSSLLFPNPSLQRRLEPILLRERPLPQDVERIGSILEDAEWTIRLRIGRETWDWRPHESLIPVYLERFHMTWRIDRKLLRRIVQAVGKREWKDVVVRLRNRGFPKTSMQSRLLAAFFEETDARQMNSYGWVEAIDVLMESIPEDPPFSNVWELIEDRRQFWIRMYELTAASDLRLRQYPMETWMMAKTPMGALVKEETIGRIETCERLLSMRKQRRFHANDP